MLNDFHGIGKSVTEIGKRTIYIHYIYIYIYIDQIAMCIEKQWCLVAAPLWSSPVRQALDMEVS